MSRKRILVLTPRFPYPVIGGDRLRIYEVCKALSQKFDLTLLSLCESSEELNLSEAEDGVFKQVQRVLLPKWQSYLNCLLALPTDKPLQVAYYHSSAFISLFKQLVDEHDAVLCHLIRTTDYAIDCGKPVVTEFTDAISLNYSRVKTLAKHGGIKNIIYSLEQARLENYEKYVGGRSALNVFVSNIDANHLFPEGAAGYSKTIVCSNGVDVNAYPFKGGRHSKEICFIGNMQSVQNMDAALWFSREVMPLLVDDGFSFKVVGRISEANAARLQSFEGVVVTGGVASVVSAVDQSFVGVCPMRIGAGVQNKILEYMALGLPCLTSSMGYEGLQAEIGVDLFIVDSPPEIAEKVKSLYLAPSELASVAECGRRYAECQHSWEGKLAPYVDRVSNLFG